MIKRKVMKGMRDAKVTAVITGNVMDNNLLYSDNILADFFKPHQRKNETAKKEEFDSSGLARSVLHGIGGNERLSSFKIPKLPVICPLTREGEVNDLEVVNNVKRNHDVRPKAALVDSNVKGNQDVRPKAALMDINVKGNQDARPKVAFIDQMVMVNDEWIKLGDYLKMGASFLKL